MHGSRYLPPFMTLYITQVLNMDKFTVCVM